MAVINVVVSFSSDDGVAESFVGADSDFTDGIYDSGEGNPAGSVRFDAGNNITSYQQRDYIQTFADFGVPAGATVTGVSAWSVEAAHFETGTNGNHWPGAYLVCDGGLAWESYPSAPESGNTAWAVLPIKDEDASMFPLTELDSCSLRIDLDCDTGADGLASVHYDNFAFTITYEIIIPPDVTLTGNLQAQDAKISGSLIAGITVAVEGNLQAQDSSISGYLRSLPGTTEAAKNRSVDAYTFFIDGLSVPLISFTVKRESARETANIVVPDTFEDIIAAASVVTINLQSFNAAGVETNTQLFTGTLDDFSTLGPNVTGNCSGAASWPATAVRYFENVSYYSDNGNGQLFRASVDARFYPGDVGMFGVRRINVTRVTISGNSQQSVMELSSFG